MAVCFSERSYYQWSETDANIVKEYFKSYVQDTTSLGTQGCLPGKDNWFAFD